METTKVEREIIPSESPKIAVNVNPLTIDLFKRYFQSIGNNQQMTEQEWHDFLVQHGKQIQENALNVFAYRCIQEGRFMTSRLRTHPHYKEVLSSIQNSRIIDIGCCLGTDLRQLLVDGAKLENMIGVDIQNDFWNVGIDLFEDKKYNSELYRSKKIFLNASFLDDNFQSNLHNFLNTNLEFDIVYMGSVLHLLTDKQVQVAVTVAHLLLKSGGIFLGQTVGAAEALWAYRDSEENPDQKNQLRFLHSPESLTEVLEKSEFKDIDIIWREGRPSASSKWGLFTFFARKK